MNNKIQTTDGITLTSVKPIKKVSVLEFNKILDDFEASILLNKAEENDSIELIESQSGNYVLSINRSGHTFYNEIHKSMADMLL